MSLLKGLFLVLILVVDIRRVHHHLLLSVPVGEMQLNEEEKINIFKQLALIQLHHIGLWEAATTALHANCMRLAYLFFLSLLLKRPPCSWLE